MGAIIASLVGMVVDAIASIIGKIFSKAALFGVLLLFLALYAMMMASAIFVFQGIYTLLTPPPLLAYMMVFMPSNFFACVSAILLARVTVFIFHHKMWLMGHLYNYFWK
jgi:hypothetical protein